MLERALGDIPDHDALTGQAIPRPVRHDDECRVWGLNASPGIAISPVEEFSGPNKLRHFIVHCREHAELWIC